jgi:hypothetical protein
VHFSPRPISSVLSPRCLLLALAAVVSTPAMSAVTFYSSLASFQANSSTTLEATFEAINHEGAISNPYTEGRVTFSDPKNLYNAMPGGPAAVQDFDAPVTSNVLTVSGNEDITMTFSGPAPTAIGFDSLTNRFGAPVVTVFDTFNVLIGTYVLTQAPSTLGFVGITSDVGIGSVHWLADHGEIKDTGIDNVRVGSIPEPQTYALMLAGLGVLGFIGRRRGKRRHGAS